MIEITKESDYVFVEWFVHNQGSRYNQAKHFLKSDWIAMTDEEKIQALTKEASEMLDFLGISTNG